MKYDTTQFHTQSLSSQNKSQTNIEHNEIQKIFDQRCVVCHSCNNAPCQLNLTTLTGLQRGATKSLVYEGDRLHSVPPTRLNIDYETESEWRSVGFFPVLDKTEPHSSLIQKTMTHKMSSEKGKFDSIQTLDSHSCPTQTEIKEFYRNRPLAGMPYGLPSLSAVEFVTLSNWIQAGAPGVIRQLKQTSEEKKIQTSWEQFLNQSLNENKLVSRYLYEHLFLAHIHFSNNPQTYFRLVRSNTSCDLDFKEIPSRRPIDDIGENFYYCFKPIQQTIVEKTHLPYLLDEKKLAWTQNNFFSKPWKVEKLPTYNAETSANPFVTFEAIPVEARYRFLIEDARYNIATFIKGPVCNGNQAVNSIDDQFYVFFIDPNSDLMVKDKKFYERSKHLLVLPSENGVDAQTTDAIKYFSKYPPLRNQYRVQREIALSQNYPNGLSEAQIWNGNGDSPNSVLTVFRHSDNSTVLMGARGDSSRSAFVLDYALFERLVYNLVVGFDVYGDLSHQLHTRIYMEMIRREGESNFLDFFPKEYRNQIKDYWYVSKLEGIKKKILDQNINSNRPTLIHFPKNLNPHAAITRMYEIFLQKRNPHIIKLFPDPINWKSFTTANMVAPEIKPTIPEFGLRLLSSIQTKKMAPWVNYYPDSSLLIIKNGTSISKIYTIIRNKNLMAVGSILFEKYYRNEENDTLTILEGLNTSYPNYFFIMQENELSPFIRANLAVETEKDWEKLKSKWGLSRAHENFWQESDLIQNYLLNTLGIEAGVVDYTHYDLWTK